MKLPSSIHHALFSALLFIAAFAIGTPLQATTGASNTKATTGAAHDPELKEAYERGRSCMREVMCKQHTPVSAVLRLDNMDCFKSPSCKIRLGPQEIAELALLKSDFPAPEKSPVSVKQATKLEEPMPEEPEPISRTQTYAHPKH